MPDFLKKLLDWIYKTKCYVCSGTKENLKLCTGCYDELERRLVKPLNLTDCAAYSAGIYTNKLQKVIRGLKYHQQKELAFYLAKFLSDYHSNCPKTSEKYTVVPVPMYPKRQRERKYNHMELVAKEFCRLTGYDMNTDLIKRIKDTKPQYKLTALQREENLRNAFQVDKKSYNGENIIVIDDILTTGTTVKEMVKEFKNAQIHNVEVLTISCTANHDM